MNPSLQMENFQAAAARVCQDMTLTYWNYGASRTATEAIHRVRPLLDLCRQAEAQLQPVERPHGMLEALLIRPVDKIDREQPWRGLLEVLEHADEQDGLYATKLLMESRAVQFAQAFRGEMKIRILNRPGWRVEAIEAYPSLFASRRQTKNVRRSNTDKAPFNTEGLEAPERWRLSQEYPIRLAQPAEYDRNAYKIFLTTISLEEFNDVRGVESARRTIEALKNAGAELVLDRRNGASPLHNNSTAMPARLKAMCQAFPQLMDRLDFHGYAPLHHAVSNRYKPGLSALMEAGCDLYRANHDGQSPLDMAVSTRQHLLVAEILTDPVVSSDERSLKRASTWLMGNLEASEFKPKPNDEQTLALLQAAQAKLAISRISRMTAVARADI